MTPHKTWPYGNGVVKITVETKDLRVRRMVTLREIDSARDRQAYVGILVLRAIETILKEIEVK